MPESPQEAPCGNPLATLSGGSPTPETQGQTKENKRSPEKECKAVKRLILAG